MYSLQHIDECFAQLRGSTAVAWRYWREAGDIAFIQQPSQDVRCVVLIRRAHTLRNATPEMKLLRTLLHPSVLAIVIDSDGRVWETGLNREESEKYLGPAQRDVPDLADCWLRITLLPRRASTRNFSLTGRSEDERWSADDFLHATVCERVDEALWILDRAREEGVALPDAGIDMQSLLLATERARLRGVRNRMLRHLDNMTLQTLRDAGTTRNFRLYNWLLTENPSIRRRRAQAFSAFPFPIEMLIGHDTDLDRTIDDGGQLVDSLAGMLAIRKWVIRALARKPSHYPHERQKAMLALRMLNLLSPEQIPVNRAEWLAFSVIAQDFGNLFQTTLVRHLGIEAIFGVLAPRLRSMARHGWILARQRWLSGYRHTQNLSDLADVLETIGQVIDGEGVPDLLRSLLALGPDELRDLSENYHERLARCLDDALDADAAITWPAIAANTTIDDIHVTALTTPAALREEGKALRHCVGGYALRCLLEPVHIISLRDSRGHPRSTAELRIERSTSGLRARIVQHRAQGNRRPSPHLNRILHYYVAQCAQTDLAFLEQACARRMNEYADLLNELKRSHVEVERHALMGSLREKLRPDLLPGSE